MPVTTLIAIIATGGGTIMLLILLRMWTRARASRSWPEAPGRVLSSEVQVGTNRHTGIPVVHYTYTVDGREYEGSRISQGSSISGYEAAAEMVVERYPVDAAVAVRYDPESPEYSVLETGMAPGVWQLLMIAAFFLALGLLIWTDPGL